MKWFLGGFWVWGALLMLGCSSEDDRSAILDDGDGPPVKPLPDAGPCEPVPSKGHSLGGRMFMFADDRFTRAPAESEDYTGTVEFQIEAFPCKFIVQEFNASPGTDFFIQGTKGGQNWLRRAEVAGDGIVYPTLSPITTDADPMNVDFHFAKRIVVEKIYSDAGVTLDPTKATMVLRNGTNAQAPGTDLRACRVDGVWTLDNCTQGPPAAFLNVNAEPYPGGQTTINLGEATFAPSLAAGALSVFDAIAGG